MARIPDLKRIAKEDFPAKYRDLIEKLAFPINSHIEQVRSALNKNINFENLAQELKTLTFTTGSNGQPLNTVTFRSDLSSNVQGIIPVRTVITSSNTSFADNIPTISWVQNRNIVTINYIGNLQPETDYQITILTL